METNLADRHVPHPIPGAQAPLSRRQYSLQRKRNSLRRRMQRDSIEKSSGATRRGREILWGIFGSLEPGVVLAVAIKKLGARSGIRRDRMCFAKSWEASRRRQGVWSQCPRLSQFLSIPTDFYPRDSSRKLPMNFPSSSYTFDYRWLSS